MLSICNTYHYVMKLKRGYFHVVKRLHLMLYCRKCYNRFYILSSLWHAVCSLPGTPLDTGTIKKMIFDRRSTFAFFKLSKHRQFFFFTIIFGKHLYLLSHTLFNIFALSDVHLCNNIFTKSSVCFPPITCCIQFTVTIAKYCRKWQCAPIR